MATAQQRGMLTQGMSPEQARLLDQQMRQKQFQGRNFGGGALGGFLTSASGAMASAANAGQGLGGMIRGERTIGANEREAEQAKVAQRKQLTGKMASAIRTIINTQGLSDAEKRKAVDVVKSDPTGKAADEAINKYGFSDIAKEADKGEWKSLGGNSNTLFNSLTGETKTVTVEEAAEYDTLDAQEKANLYKDFTAESIRAHLKDPSNPLIPLKGAEGLSEERTNYLIKKVQEQDIQGVQAKYNTIQQQSNLLSEGVITGFGAEGLKMLAKAGSLVGALTPEQQDTLANTETFDSNAGNLVAQVIKAFGSGTGLSDADREYAKKIAGGLITLSDLSLKRILDIANRRAIDEMKQHNATLSKLGKEWEADKVEIPRYRRLDLSTLETSEYNGVTYYVDRSIDGYTDEVYDINGFLVPSRKDKE